MTMPAGWKPPTNESSTGNSRNSIKICQQCNRENKSDLRFCNYCGTQFHDDDFSIQIDKPTYGFQTYDLLEDGVRFQYPNDWKLMDSGIMKDNPAVKVAIHPPITITGSAATFFAIISQHIPILPTLISQSSEQAVLSGNVQSSLSQDTHIIESSPLNVAGKVAHKVVESNDRNEKDLKIYTIFDDVLWAFNFHTTMQLYSVYHPTVERIVNSIRFARSQQFPSKNSSSISYEFTSLDLSIAEIEPKTRLERSEEILQVNPNDSLAWNSKGLALYELENPDDALRSFDKAITLDPQCFMAWANRGRILNYLNRDDEAIKSYANAIEYLDKAIASNPNDYSAWKTKADSLFNLERYDNAIECYNNAINLLPTNSTLWSNKGFALSELGQSYEAIKCFDKAIELNPKNVEAWNNKAFVCGNLEKYDEEIDCHSKVLELEPNNHLAWHNKGFVLSILERFEEALHCYNKVTEINPTDIDAWNNKCNVLLNLEKYEEAIKCSGRSLELNSKNPTAKYNMACAEIKLGKLNEGLCDLETSIQLGGEEYSDSAKKDESFGEIRNNERFKKLLGMN